MLDIEEYIRKPQSERQAHLRLDDPCIERGGLLSHVSSYCRGLLTHMFDTTMPSGMKILICHACHNGACSNPKHLYWGTAKENVADSRSQGTHKTVSERVRDKYGSEVSEICRRAAKERWKKRKSLQSIAGDALDL